MKKHHYKKVGMCGGILAVAYIIIAGLFTWHIDIQAKENLQYHQEYKEEFIDPGATATLSNYLIPFYHKKIDVVTVGEVHSDTEGTYDITYATSFLFHKKSIHCTVTVSDTKGPEITLMHKPDYYTPYNHPYEEEGYTAIDKTDGDMTSKVKSEIKDDTVIYTAVDSKGNSSTVTRKIPYDDRKGPEITFANGANEEILYLGRNFSPSYTAIDDVDGDITNKVQQTGAPNINAIGDYKLQYSVSDAHNNTTTTTYTVHVRPLPVNKNGPEDNKTIYLTFDDGPSPYTTKLLDTLDKYNIKVTFFTTSIKPNYNYMIAEEARRGHTIAVHTYTHNYGTVYSSSDNFWNDINQQLNVIIAQTGSSTNLLRFPGGSSNTVSRRYSTGIMSALASDVASKGMVYFDWNVSSGDAGGASTSEQVLNNVIAGVTACSNANKPSVVLQHDTQEFSVDAVDEIIEWGLANGYHFETLSQSSYTAHHPIAN